MCSECNWGPGPVSEYKTHWRELPGHFNHELIAILTSDIPVDANGHSVYSCWYEGPDGRGNHMNAPPCRNAAHMAKAKL